MPLNTTVNIRDESYLLTSDTDKIAASSAKRFDDSSIFDEHYDSEIQVLEEEFETVCDKQGFLGKLWDGFKNFTGIGLSSDDVKEKIQQYEKGEIDYQEAVNCVESYREKQDNIVNIVTNAITGLATAGLAVTTGGVGAIIAGAIIGGLTKAGLKTIDRATNNIADDELDVKQIIKDGATGAVDGIVSAATAGFIKAPIAGQTVGNGIKLGVLQGAKAGVISGAATGAAEYTVEVATENDKDFSFDELLTVTTQNALTGAITGGIFGGITGGISQNNLNKKVVISHNENLGAQIDSTSQAMDYLENFNYNNPDVAIVEPEQVKYTIDAFDDLSVQSQRLATTFDSQIDQATEQVSKTISDKSQIELITARPKSQSSTFAKLAKKKIEGAQLSSFDDCYEAIGDAVGIRVQIKSLDSSASREVVEDVFKKYNISATYDDFVRYIQNDSLVSSKQIEMFSNVRTEILDSLRTLQTQNVIDQLAVGIRKGQINITEINNYGTDLTSYFTEKQIAQLFDAYDDALSGNIIASDEPFKIVTRRRIFDDGNYDITDGETIDVKSNYSSDKVVSVKQNTQKALKDCGYSSAQMNLKHKLSGHTVANGELQIRGVELNSFADVEHIPYDIRTGKINFKDPKYAEIYDVIHKMSAENYGNYNRYISDMYKFLRMKELGLISDDLNLPDITSYITNGEISDELLSKLDMNGLIELAKKNH